MYILSDLVCTIIAFTPDPALAGLGPIVYFKLAENGVYYY